MPAENGTAAAASITSLPAELREGKDRKAKSELAVLVYTVKRDWAMSRARLRKPLVASP